MPGPATASTSRRRRRRWRCDRPCRWSRPTVGAMTTSIAVPPAAGPPAGPRAAVRVAGSRGVRGPGRGDRQTNRGGRGTAQAPAGAVAVPGQRFQDLPVALPVPGGGSAPGAAERARRPGHPGAQRAGADVRPAGRRADTRPHRGPGRSAVGADGRRVPRAAGLLPAEDWPAGWSRRRTWSGRTSPWRIRSRFTPEACEFAVEIEVADAVPLRGFLDRLDLAPTGQLRVVDYKTGRAPDPDFQARAVPAEVLRADDLPVAWGGAGPAQVDLPRRRVVADLRPTESEL